jgi:ABC-type dipeptide/oligopeptide/nickel transport system ATPase subunit
VKTLRKRISLVFQDPFSSLNQRTRAGTAIAEPLRVHGLAKGKQARNERVDELLGLVGLSASFASRYPHELSGGQRQRVSIARALATEPDLLILDESTASLDVSVQARVLELLTELQRDLHLTYLFIGHDLAVIQRMSHDVLVMRDGSAVEYRPAGELFENPEQDYTRALLAAVPPPRPRRGVGLIHQVRRQESAKVLDPSLSDRPQEPDSEGKTMKAMKTLVAAGAAAAALALAAPAHADVAPVNQPVTDEVAAELVQAGAVLTGRPASEFGGLREGQTYVAILPQTGDQYAAAKLYANDNQMEAAIMLQDQNSYMSFYKSGVPGSTWIPHAIGFGPIPAGEAPCPLPESVRDVWGWPQGKCYPPR